ncbi:MAG: hypothetical protein ABI811_20605 [Acidobacteriota bacterium]
MTLSYVRTSAALVFSVLAATSLWGADSFDYRVLATKKTSTAEKEMNEAAAAGFEFNSVMGGDTAVGGSEVVVVMSKLTGATKPKKYKLLATSKTSTMQKEMQALGDEGFEFKGQTVFESTFGGREVAVIMELDTSKPVQRIEYRLLATSKTSTMQKELQEAGAAGFGLTGLTVGKTALGGNEIVSVMRRIAAK